MAAHRLPLPKPTFRTRILASTFSYATPLLRANSISFTFHLFYSLPKFHSIHDEAAGSSNHGPVSSSVSASNSFLVEKILFSLSKIIFLLLPEFEALVNSLRVQWFHFLVRGRKGCLQKAQACILKDGEEEVASSRVESKRCVVSDAIEKMRDEMLGSGFVVVDKKMLVDADMLFNEMVERGMFPDFLLLSPHSFMDIARMEIWNRALKFVRNNGFAQTSSQTS
ncbi:hypothetical protein SDJN02_15852, partial [Cucurbita argyrosperma subsp. argyrosperma]